MMLHRPHLRRARDRPAREQRRNTSARPAPGPQRRAETVEVSCHTVSYRSRSNTSPQSTDPGTATRPRSLRSRSTIIAFSARSFTEPRRRARRPRRPRSGHRPRGAVPFIGRVVSARRRRAGRTARARPTAPGSGRGSGSPRTRPAARSRGRGRGRVRRPATVRAQPERVVHLVRVAGGDRVRGSRPIARVVGRRGRSTDARRAADRGSGPPAAPAGTVSSRRSNIANHASGSRSKGSPAARGRTTSERVEPGRGLVGDEPRHPEPARRRALGAPSSTPGTSSGRVASSTPTGSTRRNDGDAAGQVVEARVDHRPERYAGRRAASREAPCGSLDRMGSVGAGGDVGRGRLVGRGVPARRSRATT